MLPALAVYNLAIDPLREKGANLSMTLLLSNPDITSKKEEILFDFQCFVAEFGGALGLFLGFSFVMVWDGLQTLFILTNSLIKHC